MSTKSILHKLRLDFLSSLLPTRGRVTPEVFLEPERYSEKMSMEKLVADPKVAQEGVENYKRKIKNGEKMEPLIVVKHPRKDCYAVLDGHHRYFAYRELGTKEVSVAVVGDYSKVIYYLTKEGYLQPNSEITKKVRIPAIKLQKNIEKFLSDFAKD